MPKKRKIAGLTNAITPFGRIDPTAVSGKKPNPSMTGRSRHNAQKDPAWLQFEREILEWWLTVRETLAVPIPRNPRDSEFLHAEKELLEWWHTVREDLI